MIFTKKNKLTENDEKHSYCVTQVQSLFFFLLHGFSYFNLWKDSTTDSWIVSIKVSVSLMWSDTKNGSFANCWLHSQCLGRPDLHVLQKLSFVGLVQNTSNLSKDSFLKKKNKILRVVFYDIWTFWENGHTSKNTRVSQFILADKTSVVLLYATVQSQVDNSCTFLRESGCWRDVLYPQANHRLFVPLLLYIRVSLKLSEGFTTQRQESERAYTSQKQS